MWTDLQVGEYGKITCKGSDHSAVHVGQMYDSISISISLNVYSIFTLLAVVIRVYTSMQLKSEIGNLQTIT
jgi:hypothetical protein